MNSAWLYNRNRIIRQRSEESMRQQQIANPTSVDPNFQTDLPLEQTMLLLLNDDTVTTLSIGTGLTGPA